MECGQEEAHGEADRRSRSPREKSTRQASLFAQPGYRKLLAGGGGVGWDLHFPMLPTRPGDRQTIARRSRRVCRKSDRCSPVFENPKCGRGRAAKPPDVPLVLAVVLDHRNITIKGK